jgi:hypothetical protein
MDEMSFESEAALLEEYNEWKLKGSVRDTSASAFLVDRAQRAAFQKLEQIIEWHDMRSMHPVTPEQSDLLDELQEIYDD